MPVFAISTLGYALNGILIFLSLVLMLIVLIQKGKGGGLAGAFGGAGGSSAFGSRAGDAFTKLTLWVAAFWVVLIMWNVKSMQTRPAAAPPVEQTSGDTDNS